MHSLKGGPEKWSTLDLQRRKSDQVNNETFLPKLSCIPVITWFLNCVPAKLVQSFSRSIELSASFFPSRTYRINILNVDGFSRFSYVSSNSHPERNNDLISLGVDGLLKRAGFCDVEEFGHQIFVVSASSNKKQWPSVAVGEDAHILGRDKETKIKAYDTTLLEDVLTHTHTNTQARKLTHIVKK